MALIQRLSTKTLFVMAAGIGFFGIRVAFCCWFDVMAHPVFFPAAGYMEAFKKWIIQFIVKPLESFSFPPNTLWPRAVGTHIHTRERPWDMHEPSQYPVVWEMESEAGTFLFPVQ